MKGLPKHYNTKEDVTNAVALFGADAVAQLQAIHNNRFISVKVRNLDDNEEPVLTESQFIAEDAENVRVLYDKAEDPHAYLFRLGFTADELESMGIHA